jgi:hypothetical protein
VAADLIGKTFAVFAIPASGGGGSVIQSARPADRA